MIFFITFHATPEIDHPDYHSIGGAYINCWIESNNLESAKNIAMNAILNLKWMNLKLEEGYEIDSSDYGHKLSGKEYYEQALTDKEVYLIHQYIN